MKTLTDVFFGGISPVDQLTGIIQQSGLKVMTQAELNTKKMIDSDIEKLESQGCQDVEAGSNGGYWFECDDYTYYVDCPGDNLSETLQMAELYSPCCGEYVDQDWMICPCCKEHV
jgi:hypothetical protein